jgi:hypothetical protein
MMRRLTSIYVLALCGMIATNCYATENDTPTNMQSVPITIVRAAPLDAAVTDCIRGNAPKVEAAISDLKQAAIFLVQGICAVPVAKENAERMKRQTEAANAQWQKMCDDEKASSKETSTKKASENAFSPCSMVKVTQRLGIVNTSSYAQVVGDDDADDEFMFVGQGSPADVALASSLLLDLRLSHSTSGQPR